MSADATAPLVAGSPLHAVDTAIRACAHDVGAAIVAYGVLDDRGIERAARRAMRSIEEDGYVLVRRSELEQMRRMGTARGALAVGDRKHE